MGKEEKRADCRLYNESKEDKRGGHGGHIFSRERIATKRIPARSEDTEGRHVDFFFCFPRVKKNKKIPRKRIL